MTLKLSQHARAQLVRTMPQHALNKMMAKLGCCQLVAFSGEGIDDLRPFSARAFARNLMGFDAENPTP